ncbi:MAG: hypothetical protein JST06_11520 [Bacteroidetes bacterium]|nr:hypothetical protein [Bacteroidota bacterium]MBS1629709.1 hypothetical protein [Bacteroidota bacterium]
MKKLLLPLLLCCVSAAAYAQEARLSGDFQANYNFYQYDASLVGNDTGASNTNPLYKHSLSGGEAWLTNRLSYKGFTAFLRIDAFNNSNLYDPQKAFTSYGIGAWSVNKQIGDLTITGGYIYDQIGSGLLFRAYEDRGLLIDNALEGVHIRYQIAPNITLKAFTGQQKEITADKLNERYQPIIKGFNAEGDFDLGSKVHIVPGVGVLNRTLDDASMSQIVANIDAQPLSTRFDPQYNMYAFTGYNTLTVGDFSWYLEGAYKTHEAIVIDNTSGMLADKDGNAQYTTLGYARKGIAINLTGKRTENFVMRTSPNETLFHGMMNWQPLVARIRPQRLISRYSPASQDLSEMAGGIDVLLSPNDNLDFTLNYTHINTLEDVALYREAYADVEYRGIDKWTLTGGIQYMNYNQELYQIRPGRPMVIATTGFADVTYRLSDKKSLRFEAEYMDNKQDYGSWAFALIEFNIAPTWSFSVSDMYITDLNPNNLSGLKTSPHYYNAFISYTKGPHRFTFSYVKQPDGINCTGGVCRYEPAFSGLRLGLTTSW